MRKTLKNMADFLDSLGIPFFVDHGCILRFMSYPETHVMWPTEIMADEEEKRLIFYSYCPEFVPKEKIAKVSMLVAQINYCLNVNNFELDITEGVLRCRTSFRLPKKDIGFKETEINFFRHLIVMEKYLPIFLQAMHGLSMEKILSQLKTGILLAGRTFH